MWASTRSRRAGALQRGCPRRATPSGFRCWASTPAFIKTRSCWHECCPVARRRSAPQSEARGLPMSSTTKPVNQRAWFLILPVIVCVAFSAILRLMTVVNYSVQDIISPERRVFVGTEWFAAVMRDEELHAALWRQLSFSLAVLAVEIPLGILLALSMPTQGWKYSAVLVLVVLLLLIPWNVVGTIWQIFGRS